MSIPNSVTEIGECAFGYYEIIDVYNLKEIDGFTISGYKGSAAEAYAKKNGFEFVDLEHKHSTQVQNRKDATCMEDGYTGDEVCTVCGKTVSKGKTIKATGHKTKIENRKDATCTEDGYTGDEICKTCGETVKKGKTIKATGHKTKVENRKDATCTEDGYTGDEVCTVCGETVSKGKTIKATGHTVVIDPAVKATYAAEGKTEGSHCSVCGEIIEEQQVVPKKTVAVIKGLKVTNVSTTSLKITWTKNTKVTGYQIQYATNSTFKKAKTVTVKSKKTASTTISKLKKGKKYYVRICGYKTYKGTNYLSEWSPTKRVTIKK